MPEDPSDQELERMIRDGLTARAERAGTDLPVRVASSRPRRRRTAWLAAAAAAAVVVAVPVGGQLLRNDADTSSDEARTTTDRDTATGGDWEGWRVESYDGVQVLVPPDWGWGGAPMRASWTEDRPVGCGANAAFVVPGSNDYENVPRGTPFVGRPAMMTDACEGYDLRFTPPDVDAVWLGSPLATGTRDVGEDQVAETVSVGDQQVTVFSRDAELRDSILGTAQPVDTDDNGCAADPVPMPAAAPGDFVPTSISVCVYDVDEESGRPTLVWSGSRGARSARAYADAQEAEAATADPDRPCGVPDSGQWIALGLRDAGDVRWDVLNFECSRIASVRRESDGTLTAQEGPVSESTVAPWAGGGVRAYAWGPSRGAGGKMDDYFRGILG